jgi:hypothetical protein
MSAALKGVGAIWPVTEDEKLADATQRLERPRGRYLWADGFPLWEMIPILAAHENSEGVDRIFGALLAYEQGSFTEDL